MVRPEWFLVSSLRMDVAAFFGAEGENHGRRSPYREGESSEAGVSGCVSGS